MQIEAKVASATKSIRTKTLTCKAAGPAIAGTGKLNVFRKDRCQTYVMEGGDILPPTQMIPQTTLQQHLVGEGTLNDAYVPVAWETENDQGSIQALERQGRHLFQPNVDCNKKRPVSDVGADLQNRWKLKKEHSKIGLANRSLPERNSNLSFQVILNSLNFDNAFGSVIKKNCIC